MLMLSESKSRAATFSWPASWLCPPVRLHKIAVKAALCSVIKLQTAGRLKVVSLWGAVLFSLFSDASNAAKTEKSELLEMFLYDIPLCRFQVEEYFLYLPFSHSYSSHQSSAQAPWPISRWGLCKTCVPSSWWS